MSISFSATDLARCEAVSRTLLSPLTADSVDDWRCDVNRALRTLFRGDAVLFMMPRPDGPLVYSDHAPDVARDFASYISLTPEGQMVVDDPVLGPWAERRRAERVDVFNRRINADLVLRTGRHPLESPLIHEVLLDNGLIDYEGMFADVGTGETLLWVLHERPEASPFGPHSADVMRAFLPSFQAGLDALRRVQGNRQAFDAIEEPLAVFDGQGRRLFQNTAMERMLADDPERNGLERALASAAFEARLLCLPGSRRSPATNGRLPFGPKTRAVTTRRGRYVLRPSVAEAGTFHGDESILVSVEPPQTSRLPTPAALQEWFGLTPREAEVTGLLAEGLSNPEIAERLFISPHTAKRHVEKVLDKLEVSSRAAVHARLLQPVG